MKNNHAYAASKKATLRIKRKPGETMEVDWIGDTLKVYDTSSCCEIPAYILLLSSHAACTDMPKLSRI